MKAWHLTLVLGAIAQGCSGTRGPPPGPPPEYERPVLLPWDAGHARDPLEQVEGEEVTDEPADAGAVTDSGGSRD